MHSLALTDSHARTHTRKSIMNCAFQPETQQSRQSSKIKCVLYILLLLNGVCAHFMI